MTRTTFPANVVFAALIVLLSLPVRGDDTKPPKEVTQLLITHCAECHGEREQKGDLRLDNLQFFFDNPSVAAHWVEAMDRLHSGDMPPEKVKIRPDPAAIAAFADWVTARIREAEAKRRGADGAVVLRRLNRNEYHNTLRDLFGQPILPPFTLPADNPMLGFNNIGSSLVISPTHMQEYLNAAHTVVEDAIVTGGRPTTVLTRAAVSEFRADGKLARAQPNILKTSGHKGRAERDGLILQSGDLRYLGFPTPKAGRYTLRLRAAKVQEDRAAVPITVIGGRLNETLLTGLIHKGKHNPQIVEHSFYWIPEPTNDRRANPQISFRLSASFKNGQPRKGSQDPPKTPTSELWIDYLELEGPIHDAWPPESHSRWFGGKEQPETLADAKAAMNRFLSRAYRRPATEAEIEKVMDIVNGEMERGEPMIEAVKLGMEFALCSPSFLYLVEPKTQDGKGARELTEWEIASRLSYFLWSSMPDLELFKLARTGVLRDVTTMKTQVKRMIEDPRSRALADGFCAEWLELGKVTEFSPDQNLYPSYDAALERSMIGETQAFFMEILRHGLDVNHFLKSDFTMLNERLATHYGIPGVTGDAFRRVALPPDSNRGGLLTQASIHKITSDCQRTKPVARGKWILDNIFNTPPPSPPPNVGEFEPVIPNAAKLSTRQRLAAHRKNPACYSCHERIDPLGFSLENYDAIGAWRTEEVGAPGRGGNPSVDASGKTPDGRSFADLREFQEILLAEAHKFHRGLAEKMFVYALGRPTSVTDRPTLDRLAANMSRHRTLEGLIVDIVTRPEFISK